MSKKIKEPTPVWMHLTAFGLVAVLFLTCSLPSKKEKDNTVLCSEGSAFVYSQEYVKRNLKAPKTAEFPSSRIADGVNITDMGMCTYRVSAWVDAQNSFGAMIRNNYVVTMTFFADEQVWRGSDLEMQ